MVEQVTALRDKYNCRHFRFPMSPIRLRCSGEGVAAARGSGMSAFMDHADPLRETLRDQAIWDLAAKAGCCTLYYGMESAKRTRAGILWTNMRGRA